MRRIIPILALVLIACLLLWAATATQDPTALDASYGTWSSTAYTNVNDYPDSSCSTVNTCTALGSSPAECQLTYTFTAFSVPAAATSISVQVLYYDSKAASQSANIGGRLKVGGSYYNATTHNPANATCTSRSDSWANNPKTSAAWTVAQVNGTDGTNPLQAFGVDSSDTTPNVSVGSLRLQVTYTLPSGRNAQTIVASAIQWHGQ